MKTMLDIPTLINLCKAETDALPISHYLGRKITVEFKEQEKTSYYDGDKDQIVVAGGNVLPVLIKQSKISQEKVELAIRPLLYHELSHALLTPKDMKLNVASHRKSFALLTPTLENIIEDERIETLCKHYYALVDFKKNLYRLSGEPTQVANMPTSNFNQFVFKCLRYRLCSKAINQEINKFIARTSKINRYGNWVSLAISMDALLIILEREWNRQQAQQQQNQSNSNGNSDEKSNSESESENQNQESNSQSNENDSESKGSEEQSSGNADNSEEQEKSDDNSQEKGKENAGKNGNGVSTSSSNKEEEQDQQQSDDIEEEYEFTKEQAQEVADKMTQESVDNSRYYGTKQSILAFNKRNDIVVDLQKIIAKHDGFGIDEEPTTFGYSGTFKTGRYMTDFADECKWFEKTAMEDSGFEGKKNQAKVLNIWLDNSGSFSRCDYDVNLILRALVELEKRYETFNFRLICWGDEYIEKQGNDRISCSNMGTTLHAQEFTSLFKKYNATGNERNIFLTDGSISFCIGTSAHPIEFDSEKFAPICLSPLNNENTIIISYTNNAILFDTCCPKATRVYENQRYPQKLKENIIKTLNLIW